MGARTGSQFLDGLRKTKREIWVDGERIEDVTTHPKLRGGVESLAAIFDRQHAYAADCLFMHPDSGQPAWYSRTESSRIFSPFSAPRRVKRPGAVPLLQCRVACEIGHPS